MSFATFKGRDLLTLDGGAPLGFELAGADGIFHPAEATIAASTVLLRCPAVPEPRQIRHAWQIGVCPNLSDASAIPALPFRYDDLNFVGLALA